jgi:indole-3-glycerol phosphate synthase
VSESGIKTRDDVLRLENTPVDALLVGEALMRADRPGETLGRLMGRTVRDR